MIKDVFKRAFGVRDVLCDRVRDAAVELSRAAKDLRENVSVHETAPDPLASVLSSMWNNHEYQKYALNLVDSNAPQGVETRLNRAVGS